MNTLTIGEQIYKGMGAAGWLLGFLILFAGALIALCLIAYGVMLIAQAGEKANRKEVNDRAGAQAVRYQPYHNAHPVGKHVAKRP